MDSLSVLLKDLDLSAKVFFSGGICGLQHFEKNEQEAHVHFLKSGCINLETDQGHKMMIDKPSVIFLPGGNYHKIQIPERHGCELVCATVGFKANQKRVLIDNLPKFLCIDVAQDPDLYQATDWIFREAFDQQAGKEILISRLCDVFMIQLLRYVINQDIIALSSLAAHSHPSLSQVVSAINESPQQPWSIDEMANMAAMSRSKFSALFKDTLGQSPIDYLTENRIQKAQDLIISQTPISLVAEQVGYEDASSLSRVFKKRLGLTPKEWQKQHLSNS